MKFWVPGRLVDRVPKEVPEDRRADKKMPEQSINRFESLRAQRKGDGSKKTNRLNIPL